jgi:hypothetical protein
MGMCNLNDAVAWLTNLATAADQAGLLDHELDHRHLQNLPNDHRVAPEIKHGLCDGPLGATVVHPNRISWAIALAFNRHAKTVADTREFRVGKYLIKQFFAKRLSTSNHWFDAKIWVFTRTGIEAKSAVIPDPPSEKVKVPIRQQTGQALGLNENQEQQQPVLVQGRTGMSWKLQGKEMAFGVICGWN